MRYDNGIIKLDLDELVSDITGIRSFNWVSEYYCKADTNIKGRYGPEIYNPVRREIYCPK